MTTRTALTTGANSGIGLATVVELARRGFRSVGTVRSQEKADALARVADEAGVEVETVVLDVTDAGGCERVMDQVRPDALVNNAGALLYGAVEDVTDDEARALLEVMVLAPARLARLAAPTMRARGWGRVVNVSSIGSEVNLPMQGWYNAAKRALDALSDALRVELASSRVSVISIHPGGFKTGIIDELERSYAARAEHSHYRNAYGRMRSGMGLAEHVLGDPRRVAATIGKALTARYPRAQYVVGPDAHVMGLTNRLLPTRVKDELSRRALGL